MADDVPITASETFGAPGPDKDPLLLQMEKWIKSRKAHWSKRYTEVKANRRVARGEISNEIADEPRMVRSNLIHSTITALMPHIYARNPDISVTPSEAVTDDRYGNVRGFAKTLEILLRREFVKTGKLKKRAKRAVRASLTSRIAWSKVTYQRDFREDPIVRQRIQDAQDDAARLEGLIQTLQNPEQQAEEEAKRGEIMALMEALQAKVEVVVAQGIVIDIIKAEHLIMDSNIDSLDEYAKCRRLVQEIHMPEDEAMEKFKDEMKFAQRFWMGEDGESHESELGTVGGGDANKQTKFVRIFEAWDLQTKHFYTFSQGMSNWLKPPVMPQVTGEQWYPFFPLGFHLIDGYVWPLALPDLLKELQDEYNATRTQLAEHREISIPHWIADKQTDRDTLERHNVAGLGEVVLVDTQGRPLNQVIEVANPPPFNPAIYDTLPIRADVDMMSGLQDANRNTITQAKTATEAEILQAGMTSRSTEMQDTIEDWITDQAQYAAEIFLQELTMNQVIRIAGMGSVWPTMSKEEIFDLVEVEVRSGTSGKPDKNRERQQWGELLPTIQGLIERAEQRMMMGLDPRPMIELLRITMKRFDERMDLEEILPQGLLRFAQSAGGMQQQQLGMGGGGGMDMGALLTGGGLPGQGGSQPNLSGPQTPAVGPPTIQ